MNSSSHDSGPQTLLLLLQMCEVSVPMTHSVVIHASIETLLRDLNIYDNEVINPSPVQTPVEATFWS